MVSALAEIEAIRNEQVNVPLFSFIEESVAWLDQAQGSGDKLYPTYSCHRRKEL